MLHLLCRSSLALLLCTLTAVSCISVDPKTNKPIPRGNQRYLFEEVQRNAEELKQGMRKADVLILLGSPAEMSVNGNIWVYLPERPALLVPGRALRLEFKSDLLYDHGYHAIVLGTRL